MKPIPQNQVGPTLYAELQERATLGLVDHVRSRVEGQARGLVDAIAADLTEAIRRAYREGVADGFIDGAKKQAASQESKA